MHSAARITRGLSPKLLPTRVYHLSTALRQRPPGLSVARLSFLLASRVVPMIRHTDQGFWSLYVFHRITTAAAHQPRQAVTKKRKTTESTSSPWLRGECDVAAPQAKRQRQRLLPGSMSASAAHRSLALPGHCGCRSCAVTVDPRSDIKLATHSFTTSPYPLSWLHVKPAPSQLDSAITSQTPAAAQQTFKYADFACVLQQSGAACKYFAIPLVVRRKIEDRCGPSHLAKGLLSDDVCNAMLGMNDAAALTLLECVPRSCEEGYSFEDMQAFLARAIDEMVAFISASPSA